MLHTRLLLGGKRTLYGVLRWDYVRLFGSGTIIDCRLTEAQVKVREPPV